ncbi:MAG TPA: GYF domain-containing protein [Polyangiaceae bacterium]|nr:GYF domain-containing protein [Polyangiaceae bacterium]
MNRTTDEWRCIEASGEQATLTTDELRAKLRAGQLTAATLVWRGGMPGWVPASRVPELGPEAKGPAPALPIGQHALPPPVPGKATLLGVPPAPSAAPAPRAAPPPPPVPRPARRGGGPVPAASGTTLLAVPPAPEGAPATARSPVGQGAPARAVRPVEPLPASPPAAKAGASPPLAVVPAEGGGGILPSASSAEGAVDARPAEAPGAKAPAGQGGAAGANGVSSAESGGAKALPRVVLNAPPAAERASALPGATSTVTPPRPSRVPERAGGSTLLGLSPLTAEEAQHLGALVSEGQLNDRPAHSSRPPAATPRPFVVPSSEGTTQPSLITRPAPFSAEAPDVRFPPAPLTPDVTSPPSGRPLGDFSVFDDPDEKGGASKAWASLLRRRPSLPAGSKLVAAFFGGGLLTFGALTLFARLLSPAPAAPARAPSEGPQAASAPAPGAAPNAEAPAPRPGPGAPCALGPAPARLAPRVARDVPIELAAVPGAEAVAVGFTAEGKVPRGLRVDLASLASTPEAVPAPRRPASAIWRVLPVAAAGGALRWLVDAEREGDAVAGARSVPLEPPLVVGLGEQGVLSARRAVDAPAIAWEATTAGADALRPLAVAGAGAWVAFRQGGRVFAGLLDGEGKPRGELRALTDRGLSGSPYWGQGGDEVAVAFAWRASENDPWSMRVARGPKQGPLGPAAAFATPPGGPGGDAIAPALTGLGDGRWVAAWTEGPAGARAVRVATLGPAGDVLGEAVTASPPGANAGQASVAVASGAKVMVAYLTAAGRGVYELWGASLACPSSALGSSSP